MWVASMRVWAQVGSTPRQWSFHRDLVPAMQREGSGLGIVGEAGDRARREAPGAGEGGEESRVLRTVAAPVAQRVGHALRTVALGVFEVRVDEIDQRIHLLLPRPGAANRALREADHVRVVRRQRRRGSGQLDHLVVLGGGAYVAPAREQPAAVAVRREGGPRGGVECSVRPHAQGQARQRVGGIEGDVEGHRVPRPHVGRGGAPPRQGLVGAVDAFHGEDARKVEPHRHEFRVEQHLVVARDGGLAQPVAGPRCVRRLARSPVRSAVRRDRGSASARAPVARVRGRATLRATRSRPGDSPRRVRWVCRPPPPLRARRPAARRRCAPWCRHSRRHGSPGAGGSPVRGRTRARRRCVLRHRRPSRKRRSVSKRYPPSARSAPRHVRPHRVAVYRDAVPAFPEQAVRRPLDRRGAPAPQDADYGEDRDRHEGERGDGQAHPADCTQAPRTEREVAAGRSYTKSFLAPKPAAPHPTYTERRR